MIRLFTTAYDEKYEARRTEYKTCLQFNLACAFIDEICVFDEGSVGVLSCSKLKIRQVSARPTYQAYFQWATELAQDYDISIIANSDIFFDRQLKFFVDWKMPQDGVFALSRWDVQPDGRAVLFERNDSQDAWVFKGPLRNVQADFPVGVPRCDNRFLYELKRAGYEVINPAFSLRAYHLHAGQRSEYKTEQLDHFVGPPYAYLWPHNLWSLPRTLWHNFRHPDAKVGWRLDRRKISSSLAFRAVRKVLRCFNLPRRPAT